ncbi:TetR/AcrR family transcriptional regulator [Pseudodesulfovibrio thermohalotolerans]|uniref:TetR/AcrR family transcriptional regulator n=1 Tax=Pseudodesulfovibrio thermohalotolerans TaxID=2880651 RepID=UPI002441FFB3|nr:TetR/AcrR family transcriptional regulator [Pseudodesulfovibrio thermohalotolerans]WFS61570.1 TetR/AcrR family transcriptional regulator [Pseudodesulfovibrio thermohalotolerans]
MKKDSDKEQRILDTAAELFSRQPFHKVLLSDVARVAAVGKGTLYLYFKSKDDLYFAVLFKEFSTLVETMKRFLDGSDLPPDRALAGVIRILAEHCFARSLHLELMGPVITCPVTEQWKRKRAELWTLLEDVVRCGVESGQFRDEGPAMTARYVSGLVRAVCLFAPTGADPEEVCLHAEQFVLRGLGVKE